MNHHLLAGAALLAFAGAAPPILVAASVPLDAIPARVRASNPSLAAARLEVEEARARASGAGRLANPVAGVEAAPNVKGREFSITLSFEQSFPITARLRLEKEVSAAEVAKAEAEVLDAERRLIAESQEAAIQWLAIDELVRLRGRQTDLANEQAALAEKRVSVGEGSAIDAGQFALEAARLGHAARQLAAGKPAHEGRLRALLGMPESEPVTVTGALGAPTDPSAGLAVGFDPSRRPDYRALLEAGTAADRAVALEKARKWDDVTVGGFAEFERAEDAPDGLENDTFIGFGVSIPLPWWNRNEAAVREAETRSARIRSEAAALASGIRAEAAAARDEMRAHARLALDASSSLLTLAEQQLARTEEAYAAGQAPLNEVLRARDQLLEIQTSRIEALRDYHLARVRLEAATARHLPTDQTK